MVLTRFASRSKKLALAVSLGLLLIGSPALASAILADAAEPAPAFPEFSQVAPYVTGLQKDAAALQGQLQPLVSIEQVEESLAEYDTRFQMLVKTMASPGMPIGCSILMSSFVFSARTLTSCRKS